MLTLLMARTERTYLLMEADLFVINIIGRGACLRGLHHSLGMRLVLSSIAYIVYEVKLLQVLTTNF